VAGPESHTLLPFSARARCDNMRQQGIEVVPRPNLPEGEYDAAHAELPGLNSGTRKDDKTIEWQRILAEKLTERVEGPYLTPQDDPE